MRVFRMVAGVLVGVLGLAAAGAGGSAAFWLVGPDDIVSARTQSLTSKGVAIATAPELIDYYGSRLVVRVEPVKPGAELFVGVAHDVDLGSYLERSANTRIVEFGYPSTVRTREVDGSTARVVPPTRLDWWVTTVSGSGARTLSWELSDGPYDLAVMNADGSAGVEARATVGVEMGGAFRASLLTFGVGVLLFACSILLLLRGRSRGRRRRGDDDESTLLWDGRDAWDRSEFWNAGEQASRGAPGAPGDAQAPSGGLLPLRETEPDRSRATEDAVSWRPGEETLRHPAREPWPAGPVRAGGLAEGRSGGRADADAFEAPRGRTPYGPPPGTERHFSAAPVPAEHGQPSGAPAARPYAGQSPAEPPSFETSPYRPPPAGPRPPESPPRTDDQGWTTQDPERQGFGAASPGFDPASALPWRPAGTGRRRVAPADPPRPPTADQRGGASRPGPGGPPRNEAPRNEAPGNEPGNDWQREGQQQGHARRPDQPGQAPQGQTRPAHAQPGHAQPGHGQRAQPPQWHAGQGRPDNAGGDRQPPPPHSGPADRPAAPAPYTGRRIARGPAESGVDGRSTPGPSELDPVTDAADTADGDRRSSADRSDPASTREVRSTGMAASAEVALGADYDDPPAWLPGPVGPALRATKHQDGDTHG